MYILGISCYYHDASAAIIKDNKIIAAAQEERFTRIKHDSSFPINAINFCLKTENIDINKINYIAYYEKPLLKLERIVYQYIHYFPKSFNLFINSMMPYFGVKLKISEKIKKELKFKKNIYFIKHHHAHAAGAFFTSNFKQAAILTIDGVGEWVTTSYGIGNKNKIDLKKEINFPHSLGLLYSTMTAYLGFSVNNSEYKVMGLSAYGNQNKKTNKYYEKIKKTIDFKEDGSFKLNTEYFDFPFSMHMPSQKLCTLLDGKIRNPTERITRRHKDIAAATQLIYEEILFKILKHIKKETKQTNIIISGGCALNSVANGKILKKTGFKNIWSQPDPGDGGTSIGAALYLYHEILNKNRTITHTLKNEFNCYLGPEFKKQEYLTLLKKNKIKYTEFKSKKELLKTTAKMIYDNKVVGWFQGRMEWGPRALGNRSILANPCNPKMKIILNLKVKHREEFRPFAPVVCIEDANKFFVCDKPIPKVTDFMLMVYNVKQRWQKKIPSVVHVDNSARLQTIRRKDNPLYYDLIKEFGKLTKIPMLINTSFNIRGEPIVLSPDDAYNCMMSTSIDCLVMDNFIIYRKDNKKDIKHITNITD